MNMLSAHAELVRFWDWYDGPTQGFCKLPGIGWHFFSELWESQDDRCISIYAAMPVKEPLTMRLVDPEAKNEDGSEKFCQEIYSSWNEVNWEALDAGGLLLLRGSFLGLVDIITISLSSLTQVMLAPHNIKESLVVALENQTL